MKELNFEETQIPLFSCTQKKLGDDESLFDLSSHKRAKESLSLGISMRAPKFNIFVIGEDGSHRLQSTIEFAEKEMKKQPPPQRLGVPK